MGAEAAQFLGIDMTKLPVASTLRVRPACCASNPCISHPLPSPHPHRHRRRSHRRPRSRWPSGFAALLRPRHRLHPHRPRPHCSRPHRPLPHRPRPHRPPPPSPPLSPPPPSPPPAVPQLCPACRAFVNALKTDNGLRGARRVVRCDEIHIGFIGFSTASTYRLSSRIHIGFMSGSYLVHVG